MGRAVRYFILNHNDAVNYSVMLFWLMRLCHYADFSFNNQWRDSKSDITVFFFLKHAEEYHNKRHNQSKHQLRSSTERCHSVRTFLEYLSRVLACHTVLPLETQTHTCTSGLLEQCVCSCRQTDSASSSMNSVLLQHSELPFHWQCFKPVGTRED